MANIIPAQKAKLKEILNTLIWKGSTFAQKETEGKSHITTFWTTNIKETPSIMIIHDKNERRIADTASNFETNAYRISLAVDKITEENQNDVELLAMMIMDILDNNYTKTNAFWLNLENLKLGGYKMNDKETLFYRDLTLDLTNLKTRNLSP